MPPRKKAEKRNRDVSPPTYGVAKDTARDAIVAFGAGYSALLVPVERRIEQYLRQERLYAVGGRLDCFNGLATVECYNPATNVWTAVAQMTTAREYHGVATVGGYLYAVGGIDDGDNVLATVECYNPATNVWTAVAQMTTARRGNGTATVLF